MVPNNLLHPIVHHCLVHGSSILCFDIPVHTGGEGLEQDYTGLLH